MGLFSSDSESDATTKSSTNQVSVAAQSNEGQALSLKGSSVAQTDIGDPISVRTGGSGSVAKVKIQRVDHGAVAAALALADSGTEQIIGTAERNLSEVIDFAKFAITSGGGAAASAYDSVSTSFSDVAGAASSIVTDQSTPEAQKQSKAVIYGVIGLGVVFLIFKGVKK